MKKEEFLSELRRHLGGLPKEEIEDRISFYEEMIDDKISDGYNEEEVVNELGSPKDVAREIIGDVPLTKIIKERVKPKRQLKAWEIVLIIVGFPLWFPLVLALFIVFISMYAVVWSLIVALFAVVVSFISGGSWAMLVGTMNIFDKNLSFGVFEIGSGLLVVGLGLLLVLFSKTIVVALIKLTKKMLVGTKNLVVGKGE